MLVLPLLSVGSAWVVLPGSHPAKVLQGAEEGARCALGLANPKKTLGRILLRRGRWRAKGTWSCFWGL